MNVLTQGQLAAFLAFGLTILEDQEALIEHLGAEKARDLAERVHYKMSPLIDDDSGNNLMLGAVVDILEDCLASFEE